MTILHSSVIYICWSCLKQTINSDVGYTIDNRCLEPLVDSGPVTGLDYIDFLPFGSESLDLKSRDRNGHNSELILKCCQSMRNVEPELTILKVSGYSFILYRFRLGSAEVKTFRMQQQLIIFSLCTHVLM